MSSTLSPIDVVTTFRSKNAFISRHRIVTIERRFVEQGTDSFWALCVDYMHGEPSLGVSHGTLGRSERKVDYKEVLNESQFEVFARLRDLRKALAEKDAIPVYNIFTNEQLAAMVTGKVDNVVKLKAISGVGEGRVEKYGEVFLSLLRIPVHPETAKA